MDPIEKKGYNRWNRKIRLIKRKSVEIKGSRMFNTKIDAKKIKEKYAWQAYRKLDEKDNEKNDFIIVKEYIKNHGGHFAKIIKINKIKYILIYFNNENDLLQAIYKSTMEENLGKELQMKGQDVLIGKDEVFKKNNRLSVPTHTTSNGEKFVDALSIPLSTMPRSKEHDELDDLNNKFSERLDNLEKKKELSNEEGTTSKENVNLNNNKKRVVTTQG
ncbi:hypothetical protein C1646_673465 [Rhizophagus diaphanus]|nr:hypothetical protein C1646_673465 [Rhizophagus diaphanus] [Rhizophagus sp. MUCL 43196]